MRFDEFWWWQKNRVPTWLDVNLLITLPFPGTCGTLAARLEQFKGISTKKNLSPCRTPSVETCDLTAIMIVFMTSTEE